MSLKFVSFLFLRCVPQRSSWKLGSTGKSDFAKELQNRNGIFSIFIFRGANRRNVGSDFAKGCKQKQWCNFVKRCKQKDWQILWRGLNLRMILSLRVVSIQKEWLSSFAESCRQKWWNDFGKRFRAAEWFCKEMLACKCLARSACVCGVDDLAGLNRGLSPEWRKLEIWRSGRNWKTGVKKRWWQMARSMVEDEWLQWSSVVIPMEYCCSFVLCALLWSRSCLTTQGQQLFMWCRCEVAVCPWQWCIYRLRMAVSDVFPKLCSSSGFNSSLDQKTVWGVGTYIFFFSV